MKLRFKLKNSDSGVQSQPEVRTYVVTGTDKSGKKSRAKIKGTSIEDIKNRIIDLNIYDPQIKLVRKFSEIEIGNAVSQAELLSFSRQMAAFTKAGVGVYEAIILLGKTTPNKSFKRILNQMAQDIISGETLVGATRKHENIFPKYYISVLESAERTGEIADTFDLLSRYLERDLASVRSVKSALYYPATLVALSIVTVIILSVVVLPKFTIFFASLNAQLPLSTRILIASTNFIGTNWQLIVVSLVLLVLLFILFKRTDKGELTFDRLLLSLPVLGKILQFIILERFARILSNLVEGGIPLPDCLDLSASAVSNRVFRDALIKVKVGVLNGEGLSEPMAQTGVFPEATTQILAVGEQSGQLSLQLEYAADFYSKEVDYRLKNLSTLIEPIVLLIVGGGVGFVAIALISAMYGIYSSAGLNG